MLLTCVSRSAVSGSLPRHGLWFPMQATRLLCPWESPGKDTGVGCHFLLQGIFPGPGVEPRPLTLQADSLLTEPPEKP